MRRLPLIRLFAVALIATALGVVPTSGRADIQNGLGNGYSDAFDYDGATLTNQVPLDTTAWQTFPIDNNGAPVPNVWMVGALNTSSVVPGTQVKALRETKTQTVPADPIAFVRNGNWEDVIVQAKVAFDGPSINSGVGLVFRSPVDPLTGLADRNNFYLFTEIYTVPSPKNFVTGRAFALFKRVGGAYFLGGFTNTYMNFVTAGNAGPNDFHTLKVVASGPHIMGYADGMLVLNLTDTPGDDVNGIFSMPGPMLANGTAGVRTSNTKGIFDDFIVMAAPGYEGRASALSAYGQAGSGATGLAVQQTAGDTGFQYHDHDFPIGASTEGTVAGPASTGNGVTAGAVLMTTGRDGTTTSTATLLGATGVTSQTMPDGSTIDITFGYDSISATATASCTARSSTVRILNFTYLIVIKNPQGMPIVHEDKITDVVAPPNTVVSDQHSGGNTVRITLNSQLSTSSPMRMDVASVRIDLLSAPSDVQNPSNGTSGVNTGITTASITIGNVLAGRLCPPSE